MIKTITGALLLAATVAVQAQQLIPAVVVVLDNGERIKVPEGHAVVFAPEFGRQLCSLMCITPIKRADTRYPDLVDRDPCDGLVISPNVGECTPH